MSAVDSTYREVNFDGLVGPFHNYGGLSVDNFASDKNRASLSKPRDAALQGLKKMKALSDTGYLQGVIPPLERPGIKHLIEFGVPGKTESEILTNAQNNHRQLLMACSSASSMWTANAATVAPSCDTLDGKLHLVVANLSSKLHRSIEADETYRVLLELFGDAVAPALKGGLAMSDEGAANHTRLCESPGDKALHLFVYGRDDGKNPLNKGLFQGRQTRAASEAIGRKLGLEDQQCVYLQQNQDVIDKGVFHNDVIAVGNLNCYFYHESAYERGGYSERKLMEYYERLTGKPLNIVMVPKEAVSVSDAVRSYLFNSQLIGDTDSMTLVAPTECEEHRGVSTYLKSVLEDTSNPINQLQYFDLKESMRNGGGPACLRLRVVLNQEERKSLKARTLLDDELYSDLVAWVKKHYRETLSPTDLADPELLAEVRRALDELTQIMNLGNPYSFQKG